MFVLHLTDEQREIRRTVRKFVESTVRPIALERERLEEFDERFSHEALVEAFKLGLRTLALSEPNGGSGADTLTTCIVAEELAGRRRRPRGDVEPYIHSRPCLVRPHAQSRTAGPFLPEFLADHTYHPATAGHEPDTDLGLIAGFKRPEVVKEV